MAFSFNGISSNVTISGSVTTSASLPQPNALQTEKQWAGSYTAATVTIDTVPANKIWYITSVTICSTSASTGVTAKINGGGKLLAAGMMQLGAAGRQGTVTVFFPSPFKLIAADILQYVGDDTAATYCITGYEVSA